MFKDFECMINDNSSDDYWSDVALIECQSMLGSFSDKEWKMLSDKIDDYPEKTQLRCVECLSDIDNRNSLPMILRLSKTRNQSLFVVCVDSLRNMDISSITQSERERLLQKARDYSADASPIEKNVFKAFIEAIGY